jgi:SAM-dependent methyltransferase
MSPSEEQHVRSYADAIHAVRMAGDAQFQGWFDKSESIDESIRRGYWDIAVHVLVPEVVERIADPSALTVLEIGYGGGRLMNAAAAYFGRVIGIDVHEERDAVSSFLAGLGRNNVELLQTDGRSIPLADQSIDLVYSFIVLQHLPLLASFDRYLAETRRVLRNDGVAQLYFGRLVGRNPLKRFREIPDAPVNHVSLELAPRHAARRCRRAGFRVVGHGVSHKQVPDGYPRVVGGQAYVTLVKR